MLVALVADENVKRFNIYLPADLIRRVREPAGCAGKPGAPDKAAQ